MKPASEVILSIEAGVLGGSVSIKADGGVFSYSGDTDSSPKAELLLPRIDELLRQAAVSARDIKQIVVSAGPGSFTGIRIGISTALGLANAVGASVKQILLLPAMALAAEEGVVCASVPVGRGMFASQLVDITPDSIVEIRPAFLHASSDAIQANMGGFEIGRFVSLRDVPKQHSSGSATIEIANLAEQLALAASDRRISEAEPIFLSKPSNV